MPGLVQDATYCYRVYLGTSPRTDLLGTDPSPTFRAQLPARPTEPFSFAVFGDWGQANSRQRQPGPGEPCWPSWPRATPASPSAPGTSPTPPAASPTTATSTSTGSSVSGVFGPRFWAGPGKSLPLLPGGRQPHPEQHLPAQLAPAPGRGHLGRPLPARHLLLPERHPSKDYASAWYAFDAGGARFYVLQTAWDAGNVGEATQYKNDYDSHWTPDQRRVPVARGRPGRPRLDAAQVRLLPLPAVLRPEQPDLQRLPPGRRQPRGAAEPQRGRHRLQRPRPPVPAQPQAAPGGLVSYVTGGGGATLASIGSSGCSQTDAYGIGWKGTTSTGAACGAAQAPTRTDQVHHFLLVKVDGTRVTVTPTNAAGETFDITTYQFGADGAGAPTPPGGLTATAVSTSQVTLSWQPSVDDVGVNSYTIYRDGAELATVRGWRTTYADRGLPASTAHTYRVVATDGNGNTSTRRPTPTVTTKQQGTVLKFQPAKDTYRQRRHPDHRLRHQDQDLRRQQPGPEGPAGLQRRRHRRLPDRGRPPAPLQRRRLAERRGVPPPRRHQLERADGDLGHRPRHRRPGLRPPRRRSPSRPGTSWR